VLAAPVQPIPAHQLLVFLLQVGLLLILAIFLGRMAARLGLSPIVGELSAGVILGPSLFGWLVPAVSRWVFPAMPEQAHLLDAVGQIAVLLLVGLAGTEMDIRMVRRRGTTAVRISLAGLIIPFALGIGLGYPLAKMLHTGTANTYIFALFLGAD
jgi:Kef-type K+ transport system membrane component KefB